MKLDALLSTIILVSFLVTIMMAVGSYFAYKLREARRPHGASGHAPLRAPVEEAASAGESAFFERLTAADLAPPPLTSTRAPRG
jgi:hypothetical protein